MCSKDPCATNWEYRRWRVSHKQTDCGDYHGFRDSGPAAVLLGLPLYAQEREPSPDRLRPDHHKPRSACPPSSDRIANSSREKAATPRECRPAPERINKATGIRSCARGCRAKRKDEKKFQPDSP